MSSFDEDRYSRQSYTVGKDVMTKLSEAKALVIGYNILSQEIIKNLALLGFNNIDIVHKKSFQNYEKTGMYYLNKDTSKQELPLDEIRVLNPTIQINQVDIFDKDMELIQTNIKQYNIVILSNSTYEDANNINRMCRKFGCNFVMTGCYGLMGYVFNDFGNESDEFIVNDVDGEIYENLIITKIEDNNITFKDKHNLADRDVLEILMDNEKTFQVNLKQTVTPLIVQLKESCPISNEEIKNITRVVKKKIPVTHRFKMLKNNYHDNIDSIFADSSVDFDRSNELHELHKAYNNYIEENNETPRSWSIADFEIFTSYIKDYPSKSKKFMTLAKKFCFTLRGNCLPFASIIAAVVAQEALKALSHKYIPITQWYYLDYLELITDDEINSFDDNRALNYKSTEQYLQYEGLVNIFGKKLLDKIQKTIPFIIGSGAIGCELLKNLGMMGIKTIVLTDPDHIEKSNLSRQFLFNDGDIRKSKSLTAAQKIIKFNPKCNIVALEHKISAETEHIFNKDFHKKIDIYLNALDNVDARIYMDEQAIKYSKPLIDSGTMGAKGNVQVIIPYLTESYGSSKDPDEKLGIPICTIKAFPYKSEHTIQWARELFESEFNLLPSLVEKYRDIEKLTSSSDSEIKIFYRQIYKYNNFELTHQYFFNLLSTILYENFHENIVELLNKYSKPENIEELGDKKLPKTVEFNKEIFSEFMECGFNILNQMFKTNFTWDNQTDSINPTIFTLNMDNILVEEAFNEITGIVTGIPQVYKVDFEKDDDSLGHVQFVTYCANLRNEQYSIPKSNIYETRKIAGNIIPAMITTTSVVSGFQTLEFIKIIKYYHSGKHLTIDFDSDIDLYKNRFINLNNNYIDGINPGKPERTIIDNKPISIWSKIDVESTLTENVIDEINRITKNKVEFLTCGTNTIYDGDDILVPSIDFENKVLALVMINEKPVELKINKI